MKNSKKSLALFLLIMIVFMTSGCSKTQTTASNENSNEGSNEASDTSATVETNKEPNEATNEALRVVTTYKPATEIVLALGAKGKLVGANDKAKKDPIVVNLDSELANRLVEVGSKKNGLNIEQVVALNPDVVIMYPTKSGDDTADKLAAQNIEVVSINPESIELLKSDILNVGEAIGEVENSKKLVEYYEDKINYISEKTMDIKDKKTVYLAGAHGFLSTNSGDFYQHEIIKTAGGIDLAADLKGGWNDVSVEQVITWNPDVITSVMYCKEGNPKEILKREELQTLNAIKNKEVYQIPSNLTPWDMPQPSSILAIMWMSKTMYPEIFEELNIKDAANEYYSTFYGKSFDELGGVLVADEDTEK